MTLARDIIARSIETDRAGFRASLVTQAEMHDDYANVTSDRRAAQGAIASRNACLVAYDCDIDDILSRCGPMVIALNVACKLQGISAAQRTAAAVEWQG